MYLYIFVRARVMFTVVMCQFLGGMSEYMYTCVCVCLFMVNLMLSLQF